MASTAITAALLTKVLKPVITDLYAAAKDQAKRELIKWNTAAGVKKIATTLASIDKVKTIWSPEAETSLTKIYYPSALIIGSTRTIIDSAGELPEGNLVIEGIVGQGKSMFMRHIAASMITGHDPTIPCLIELRNINEKRSLTTLISLFLNSISVKNTAEAFEYLASSGKVALILDGFDEIPTGCIGEVISELHSIQTIHPDLKILISSRPQSHIQNASGFRVIKLAELSENDYNPFIAKLIPVAIKRNEVLDALTNCAPGIRGIIVTPLMLTLVVIVYQTEKEIPSTLSGFFDKLFGVVFAKHDRLKAGFNRQHFSGLSEDQLKKLFETFCFMAIQYGHGRSMREAAFNKTFEHATRFTPELKCSIDGFKKDIINVACLVIEEGLDIKTFLHKSILEYHAAAFICGLPDEQAEYFYSTAYQNYERWEHVLKFLESIDKFRFAEFYILKHLPAELATLSATLATKNIDALLSYIETLAPNSNVEFSEYKMSKFSRTMTKKSELRDVVFEKLPKIFFEICRHVTSEEISRIAMRNGQDSETAQSIPIRHVITELGEDKLFTALKTIEFDLQLRIQYFAEFVESEKLKGSLFIDMLSPPKAAARKKSPTRKKT